MTKKSTPIPINETQTAKKIKIRRAQAEYDMVKERYKNALDKYGDNADDQDMIMVLFTVMLNAEDEIDRLKGELKDD